MKHKFRLFMILYSLAAVIGIGFLWIKVWDIVKVYEQELPDYAMDDYMEKFDEDYYKEMVLANSRITVGEFEDEDEVIAKYGNISLKGKKITYEKKTGSYTNTKPVYSVTADGKEIAVIHLQEQKGKKGRAKWSVEKEEAEGITLKGEKSVTVSAPEGCKPFVNGREVSGDYITGTNEEAELLKNVEAYITGIPKIRVYTVDGLFDSPKVEVRSQDGGLLEAKKNGSEYSCGFQSDKVFEEENTPWIKEMAKAYALYLSNDGSFEKLTPYLYPDDSADGLKYKLATIGVEWYTDHTGTWITDEEVTDFKQYGENCFSCIVQFKQTVTGIGGSGTQTVVNDNRLICIFVKYQGQWKWAAMNTLEITE